MVNPEAEAAPTPPHECPDCGGAGVAIGPRGYYSCTRYRSCWSDTPEAEGEEE